jgi:hypothetical protein
MPSPRRWTSFLPSWDSIFEGSWGVEVTVGGAESDAAGTETPQTAHRGERGESWLETERVLRD